jgi:hypothetical protein
MKPAETAANSAGTFPWHEVIPILPDLFWIAATVGFLCLLGLNRIRAALERATKIGIAGLEIELKDQVAAVAAAKLQSVSAHEAGRVGRRLAAAADLLSGARFLWVDDTPSNNAREMDTLRGLNAMIDLAGSTADAQARLQSGVYDVVLSDMARDNDREAGLKLVPVVANAAGEPELIFYVGQPRSVPHGAFGLTTRPDELFHLIVDALSRRRG